MTNGIFIRKGSYAELLDNVNCIPKGVYKFIGHDGALSFFQIGKVIQFGISDHPTVKIRPLPNNVGAQRATAQEQFLDAYYELMKHCKGKEYSPLKPLTVCALCPSVAREFN